MLHTIYTSADVRTVNILRPAAINEQLKAACTELVANYTTKFDRNAITSDSDAKFNAMIERKQKEVAGTATPTADGTPSTSTGDDDLIAKMTASLLLTKKKAAAPAVETVAEETVKA